MSFESPKNFSASDLSKIEKERTLSDAELLKGGAEYVFQDEGEKRLEVTPEQIKEARREMNASLVGQPDEASAEKKEKIVDHFLTGKGSVYTYLPDGRTQRYKKVEDKKYEPQDAIVFIPGWDWVSKNAPKKVLEFLGENETQFEQTLLEFVQSQGKKVYIIDAKGNRLETNQDIQKAKDGVYLWFGHAETENGKDKFIRELSIPVAVKPKIGYSTFDTSKFQAADGKWMRSSHMGNKISEVVYK